MYRSKLNETCRLGLWLCARTRACHGRRWRRLPPGLDPGRWDRPATAGFRRESAAPSAKASSRGPRWESTSKRYRTDRRWGGKWADWIDISAAKLDNRLWRSFAVGSARPPISCLYDRELCNPNSSNLMSDPHFSRDRRQSQRDDFDANSFSPKRVSLRQFLTSLTHYSIFALACTSTCISLVGVIPCFISTL